MPEKLDLTALLGSRICHDLISPIGAIGNGVELMLMDGAQASPEMALIAESVSNANARIRFFRLAFGAAHGEKNVAKSEVLEILADMTRGSRLNIDWNSQVNMPRASVKLTFLLLMCLENAMPFGGAVAVEQGEPRWTITGRAARLKVDTALWGVLTQGPLPDIGPAQVQFPLVSEELARQHRRLTTEIADTEIRFSF